MKCPVIVYKARTPDVPGIKMLVDAGAANGALLPRTMTELYDNLRDFHIWRVEGVVLGCAALHIDTGDLAEIRSLIVREDVMRSGAGRALVEACVHEARELGIDRVYALTRAEEFFRRCGFQEIDKKALPNKVFRDCVRCPSFPDCDEVALIRAVHADADLGKENIT